MNPFKKLYQRTSYDIHDKPYYLDIEFTNNCNLACKMCGTNYTTRSKGYMTDATFEKILSYVKRTKIPVRVIGWGEPTLHPRCDKYLKALNKVTYVHLNSNGYKQAYAPSIKYSVHNDKNMLNILVRKFTNKEAEITYTTTDLENMNIQQGLIPNIRENLTDTRFIDGLDRSKKRFNRCGEVFDKLTIFWNGDITACCGDVNATLKLGNINENDLSTIWKHSTLLNEMRAKLKLNDWTVTPLCERCHDYTK